MQPVRETFVSGGNRFLRLSPPQREVSYTPHTESVTKQFSSRMSPTQQYQ